MAKDPDSVLNMTQNYSYFYDDARVVVLPPLLLHSVASPH